MFLNSGVGEDSWEFLGLQGDLTSPSWRRSVLVVHWRNWCWSWNSNTWAAWYQELTHLKRSMQERLRAGGEGTTEDEMVGWHHQLNGHGFGWTLGVGDGQEGREYCSSWGRKQSDTTEWLNWTDSAIRKENLPFAATWMNHVQGHYAKWNKSDRETQILYAITSKWSLKKKNKTREQIGVGAVKWMKLVKGVKKYNPSSYKKCQEDVTCSTVTIVERSVSRSVMSDSLRPHGLYRPGSSVHGILQARILEWLAIPFTRESSQPRHWTQVSRIAGRFFAIWATSR